MSPPDRLQSAQSSLSDSQHTAQTGVATGHNAPATARDTTYQTALATAALWQRQAPRPRHGRLALSLLLSVLFHTAVLGLAFLPGNPPKVQSELLEVALVNTRSETPPAQADILAQQALEGGGEQAEGVASSPLPRLNPQSANELFMEALRQRQRQLEQEQQALLVQLQSQRDALAAQQTTETTDPGPDTGEHNNDLPLQLLNAEIATIKNQIEQYNAHPRRHFVGPSARETMYAEYIDAWRQQIETLGTEHYPAQARGKLYGQLQLTVYIGANGELDHIDIDQPSEHAILNLAAQRIVQLASPFPPLPDAIRRDTDVLAITRTWHFTNQQLYIQSP